MARFNASMMDNYGGQGGGGFFKLANDGEVARVRFMYNSVDEIEASSVHTVEIDGKRRYVNCLREYNDPIDMCPFCRERMPVQVKLFIPVYDVDEDKVKIWERGKKFFSKLSGLCSRYPKLVEKEFEVERHGKSGDTKTEYEVFPVDDCEKLTMDDLPELADYNLFVLDKSADDMEYFLDEGVFPPSEEEAPRRRGSERRSSRQETRRRGESRRSADDGFTNIPDGIDDEVPFSEPSPSRRREEAPRESSRQSGRRTPASSRRRGSEDF